MTCQVAEWIHSLAAQLSQAPQLESYHSLLSTDHELRGRLALSKCLSDPDSALTEVIFINHRDLVKKDGSVEYNFLKLRAFFLINLS